MKYTIVSKNHGKKIRADNFKTFEEASIFYMKRKFECDQIAFFKGADVLETTSEYLVLAWLAQNSKADSKIDEIKYCQRQRWVKDCTHCIRWEKGECEKGLKKYKKEEKKNVQSSDSSSKGWD